MKEKKEKNKFSGKGNPQDNRNLNQIGKDNKKYRCRWKNR